MRSLDGRHGVPRHGMYRRIARNSAMFAAGTAAASLFTMLSVAVAARALTARDFGVLVLLQSAALMVRALTTFSTQQPVIKLGSDAQAKDDRQGLGEVISMGLAVDTGASLIAFAVAAIGIEFSRSAIGLAERDIGSAWILAASLLFTGYPTSNGIFRLYDRFGLLSLTQTISAIFLLIIYGWLFFVGAGLQAFVWAWAGYFAASSLLQLVLALALVLRDKVPLRLKKRTFATTNGRVFVDYCWTTWGTSTTEAIRTNGDSLVIGAMVSVEAAGIYNVAKQLAGVLRKFNVVYMATVFPEIARLAAANDVAGARKLNRRMFWAGLALATVAVGTAAILGGLVIKLLFGARFAPAYLPFVLLTGAAVALLVSHTPSMMVQVFKGPKQLLLLQTVATLGFAAAALVLTHLWSIAGMALAQLAFGVALTILFSLALRSGRTRTSPVDGEESLSDVAELNG